MQKLKTLFVLATWLVINMVSAMTIEAQGNKVFASGPVGDDWRQFKEAIATPGVDTVVFVNSPGGDLWTGLHVGRLIASTGLKTVIAGYCASSCSVMFMGGKERRFSDAFPPSQTFIGIHGAHNKDSKQVNASLQPQIFAFYKNNMGERFNSAVMNQALYDMDDAGALLRVFDPERSPKQAPYHCRSAQTPRNACTDIKAEDALSLGVITHRDFVKLELPNSLKTIPMIAGRALSAKISDLPKMLLDISQRKCPTDLCKMNLAKWGEYKENKALATRIAGSGYVVTHNSNTMTTALAAAIYGCNHMRGVPVQLCEAEVINDYDVRQIYRDSDQGHKDALSRLVPPTDKYFANEEYGGSSGPVNSYRVQNLQDITPQKIEGARTVGTQELARMIKSDTPPVVVDVGGASNDMVPGSILLRSGGLAFDDAKIEGPYDTRFRALLLAIKPDLDRPVVFYCGNRECWLSVNATLRAIKAGHTNVLWYRGGIGSWKAATLPIAPIAIRAVVS